MVAGVERVRDEEELLDGQQSYDQVLGLRSVLRSWLLLLLAEGKSHGYALANEARGLGLGFRSPGQVYRILRELEAEQLVSSSWDLAQGQGPSRRTYELTPLGREALAEAAAGMARLAAMFRSYGARYRRAAGSGEGLGTPRQ